MTPCSGSASVKAISFDATEIRNHLFNMYTYKKKKSTHGKQTDGKAIGQYS